MQVHVARYLLFSFLSPLNCFDNLSHECVPGTIPVTYSKFGSLLHGLKSKDRHLDILRIERFCGTSEAVLQICLESDAAFPRAATAISLLGGKL